MSEQETSKAPEGGSSIPEVLSSVGYVVICTAGTSMLPMLGDRRDTAEIHALSDAPLRKYDVVLFRKGSALVLHRIIRVLPDAYLIRGDNSLAKDTVPSENILGILTAFTRKGRRRTVGDRAYRIYSRLAVFLHPLTVLRLRVLGR